MCNALIKRRRKQKIILKKIFVECVGKEGSRFVLTPELIKRHNYISAPHTRTITENIFLKVPLDRTVQEEENILWEYGSPQKM